MKLPNGYGSVVNLGKKRRKPYAVRITDGYKKNSAGNTVQIYRYLEYFEKSKDAYEYLAKYNSGQQVKEHISLVTQPTFEELFNMWIEYKMDMNNSPSDSTIRNYKLVLGWCENLKSKKFSNIRVDDIQAVVNEYKSKSKSTVSFIRTVINQMYQYAIKREYIDKNYSELVDYEWKETENKMHSPFTDEEIEKLWNNLDTPGIDLILMMIYTGFRASEFIALENKNINLDKRYAIGGIKTSAGKNRIVPIHKKVLPLFEKYYDKERKYLIPNSKGSKYSYGVFNISVWTVTINKMNMDHIPHDTRHTLATMLDKVGANKICTKMILGHSIQDITDGVYTHKNLDDLLETIDLL